VTDQVQDTEGRFPPDLNEEVCRHDSDEELIARVREALKQIPREILREPFPENPSIDEMKAIRSYSQVAAEQALDTLARRLGELKEGLARIATSVYPLTPLAPWPMHEPTPDAVIARSLLHPEPQEE
jgi:hypothetical protein